MNKQQMLNGMSEEEFYNLYPTEEDYVMAMGGQAGNDDFYVQHQDADRLRSSTPINFVNNPFYEEGGPIWQDEGSKNIKSKKPKSIVPEKWNSTEQELSAPEVVAFMRNYMAAGSLGRFNAPGVSQMQEKYHNLTKFDRDQVDKLMKSPQGTALLQDDVYLRNHDNNPYWFDVGAINRRHAERNRVYENGGGLDRDDDYGSKKNPYPSVSKGDFAGGGRSYPIPTKADAIDALRLAGLHGRSDVRAKVFAKYPELKKAYGGQHMMPDGTMMMDDMMNTMQQVSDNHFGKETGIKSTDDVLDNKKNFFNNYIRNNVTKAVTNEMMEEVKGFAQMGGPMYEDLGQQMEDGGGVYGGKYVPLSKIDSTRIENYLKTEALNPAKHRYYTKEFPATRKTAEYSELYEVGRPDKIDFTNWPIQKVKAYKEQINRANKAEGKKPVYPEVFWQDPSTTQVNMFDVFTEPKKYGGLPKAQYGEESSPENEAFWAGNPTEDRGTALQYNTKMQCTPEQKMTPGTECYDEAFANRYPQYAVNPNMTNSQQGYSFMDEVNQDNTNNQKFGPPYEQQQTPFNKQNEFGQSLNNTGNNPLGMGDDSASKQEAYNNTPNKNMNKGFQFSTPSGMDVANNIIGTLDFFSNRLEERERKKQEKANKWRYSGDANFLARPEQSNSRGDYDQFGNFRPNQMTPVQYAGSNYGNVGSPYYTQFGGAPINEGEEVYMSDDEIQNYLAMGGTVEYID